MLDGDAELLAVLDGVRVSEAVFDGVAVIDGVDDRVMVFEGVVDGVTLLLAEFVLEAVPDRVLEGDLVDEAVRVFVLERLFVDVGVGDADGTMYWQHG